MLHWSLKLKKRSENGYETFIGMIVLLDAIKTCLNIAVWPTYISIYIERVHYAYIDISTHKYTYTEVISVFESRKAEKTIKMFK